MSHERELACVYQNIKYQQKQNIIVVAFAELNLKF